MVKSSIIVLILIVALLFSCKPEVTDIQINHNTLKEFKTTIRFTSDTEADAMVVYWEQGSLKKDTSLVSGKTKEHEIVLLGLNEHSSYSFQIISESDSDIFTSDVFPFSTASFPYYIPRFKLVTNKEVNSGYLLLRSMIAPGMQLILNNKGKVVWYQVSDSAVFRPFSMSGRNTYIALESTNEVIEMSFDGDTLNYFSTGKNEVTNRLHHEILRQDDSTIVALTKTAKEFDLTKFGGDTNEVILGDGIVVLDNSGKLLWQWSIFDDGSVGPSASLYSSRKDFGHANALQYDIDGNYLLSFKTFNQIWKIDKTDGHTIWKLGLGGDFALDYDDIFSDQHTVHINSNGNLMIFDNNMDPSIRSRRGKKSRALSFKIDEDSLISKKVLDVRLPDSLYSFKQGSVYLIDDDRLLFCSSMSKKIAITDLTGDIVWQVNSDWSFYRAIYLEELPWKLE